MAGAVFGEVGMSLLVAGTALREILGDSRSAKSCVFPSEMRFLQYGVVLVLCSTFEYRVVVLCSMESYYVVRSSTL